MPTINEMIADVRRQLAALQITDDSRLTPRYIYFVLNYCNAELTGKRIREDFLSFGSVRQYNPDQALFREYEIAIDCNTLTANLPATPIDLPMDNGLRAIFIIDQAKNVVRSVRIVNIYEAQASQQQGWWVSPKAVRHGNLLRFFDIGAADKVTVLMLSTELPEDENGNPDINAQYPISLDLVGPVVSLAVARLAQAIAKPEDAANDAKDNVIR